MRKAVGREVKKKGMKRAAAPRGRPTDINEANARFDRLLVAMATTPALPKKKKRVAPRQTADEVFDD